MSPHVTKSIICLNVPQGMISVVSEASIYLSIYLSVYSSNVLNEPKPKGAWSPQTGPDTPQGAPQHPSTQCLRFRVTKTIPFTVSEIRNLINVGKLEPFGCSWETMAKNSWNISEPSRAYYVYHHFCCCRTMVLHTVCSYQRSVLLKVLG